MAHKSPMGTLRTGEGSALRAQKLLIPGVLGFIFGACVAAVGIGVMQLHATRIIPTATTMPSLSYDVLYDYEKEFLEIDPEAAIEVIESTLQKATNDFDLAIGHYYLAEAYDLLGNDTLAVEHYEQTQYLILPFFNNLTDVQELSIAYYFVITAAARAWNFDAARQYYEEMKEVILPMLVDLDDTPATAEGYLNLINTATIMGDDNAEMYYHDMRAALNPLLDDLVDVTDIGETYTALIESATLLGDFEYLQAYNQELIDKLKPIRDQLASSEELAIVNKYLGDAESALGHFQFAAVYYNDLVNLEPTARNILLLASTYYMGGNHGCAYHWYQELLEMINQGEITSFQGMYRDIAETAIEQLEEACGESGVLQYCR